MYGEYSDLYAKWCACYDPMCLEIEMLKQYCDFRNSSILDIGCGTGRFMFRVLPDVKCAVGVDIDSRSIAVLRRQLESKYSEYQSKVKLECCNIAQFSAQPDSFDFVFFTWSFYALNREEMIASLHKINSMLRKNGKMIILQPTGGEFEKVMRLFFAEHEDMDEYDTGLTLMNEVRPKSLDCVARVLIKSEFVVSDLTLFTDVLKMFAITEGGCTNEEIGHITPQYVVDMMTRYKRENAYHMTDEVTGFVFRKR